MRIHTTVSSRVFSKRPSAHDLCSAMNSANQTDRPRTQCSSGTSGLLAYQLWRHRKPQCQNSVPMPLATVPIQLDRLQARSEKKSSKPLDSSSTFLNIAIISKLITIIRACFPLRKIRSVKRRERLYGGGRKERRVFNIYMLRSLHILFYWVLTTNPHHRYNYFHFGEKEMETLV